MPVRNWASTLASFHDNRSYSCRVCFPGGAASTLFECLPTVSGKALLVPPWDRAIDNYKDEMDWGLQLIYARIFIFQTDT